VREFPINQKPANVAHFRYFVETKQGAACGNKLARLLSVEKPPSLLSQLGHQQVTFSAAHTANNVRLYLYEQIPASNNVA
jgi:hypothetical protein